MQHNPENDAYTVKGFSPEPFTGIESRDYGLFLQCMVDNIHTDRQVLKEAVELIKLIRANVEISDISLLMLSNYGALFSDSPARNKEEYIKTRLLNLINSLDNIMTLQDENQPAIMKIATLLENLNKKETEK